MKFSVCVFDWMMASWNARFVLSGSFLLRVAGVLVLGLVLQVTLTVLVFRNGSESEIELRREIERVSEEKKALLKLAVDMGLGHLHRYDYADNNETSCSNEPRPIGDASKIPLSSSKCRIGTTWTATCDFRNVCYRGSLDHQHMDLIEMTDFILILSAGEVFMIVRNRSIGRARMHRM